MSSHPLLKGYALVLFSVCVWAGWVVVSRSAVRGALNAYDITAIRFAVAGLLLLPVVLKRGIAIGPWGVKGGVTLFLLFGATFTNIVVAGMMFAPASHAATLINGALLTVTTVVGIFGLREPTTRTRLAGVAGSLAGILCILAAKSVYGTEDQWKGHALFVLGGSMWGGYTLLMRHWKADALHAASVVCVLSLFTYLPLYLLFARSHITMENINAVVLQAFYQGLLTGVLALVAFNAGVHLLGASRAAAMVPLVPALATLFAIPLLGEKPTELEWIGVAAVSAGAFLGSGALRLPRRKARA